MSTNELLGESVHHALVERIFDGRLAPGSALSVPALAAELGVSRSPVRESVQRLVAQGIAVTVAHAGARVATMSLEDLEEVLRVREVLDGLAAAEATSAIRAGQLDELRLLLDDQEQALLTPPDPLHDAALDLRFHTFLREVSGNRTLVDTLQRLEVRAHLFGAELWSRQRDRELAVVEHRRILTAVEAGDVAGARAAAAAHVAAVAVRVRRSRA